MSKVYKCDRCGAEGNFREKGENKVFSEVIYARCLYGDKGNTIHLCPHCMKKFEEFLSDPNCMENVEEDKVLLRKDVCCDTCKHNHSVPCTICKAYDHWEPKDDMNKEESGLSVEHLTNAAGVTVPDSKPWEKSDDKVALATSDNEDDPCPCYAKHCIIHVESCCGCPEYDEWNKRQEDK